MAFRLIVFAVSFFLSSSLPAQDLRFTLLKSVPEKIGAQVLGMTQDTQGFLWISTQHGLFRYDGSSYVAYYHEVLNQNSPSSDNIECVAADSEGFIWLAPQNMGLDRLDPASGAFTHFKHSSNNPGSLGNDSVYAMITDRRGTLWIGTSGGLDRLDKGSKEFIHYRHDPKDASSLSFNEVRSLYEDKEGTIWVGTGSVFKQHDARYKLFGGLNRLNQATGKFTRYVHDDNDPHTLVDNRIRSIFEDSRGIFWVGSAGDGLHTMDRSNGTFRRHRFDPLHPERLSRPVLKPSFAWGEDHVSFITEDASGRILIGTFSAGIHVYDPSTQQVAWHGTDPRANIKIDDELFWTAYKTRDGTVWISSWGSNLYKILPVQNPISDFRTNRITISFIEDDVQNLWIGTNKGLFIKDTHGNEQRYLVDPDHPDSPANLIFPIAKERDSLLVQTSFGLYYFDLDSRKFLRFLHHDPENKNSVPSDSIPAVRKSSDGILWIATFKGLAALNLKTNELKRFVFNAHDSSSIPDDIVPWIEIDSNENLWVATANGLCRLEKGTERFKRYPGIRGIFHIMEDSQGDIWASGADGLFKYDNKKDVFNKFKHEYFDFPAQSQAGWIVEDLQNNLWIATTAGFVQLRRNDNMMPVVLGKSNGVSGLSLTSGYVRQNGNLLFGDLSGYVEINPARLKQDRPLHYATITSFLLNDEPVLPTPGSVAPHALFQTKEIRLKHNQNTFTFLLACVDFVSMEDATSLIYKLENYDGAWRKAGSEKTAYYFNVPAGTYRFIVKAFNANGAAAEKTIVMIIDQPWWKTWWAYTMIVVVIISAAYLIYRNRVLQLNKQQSRQISVMVATQEQERKRISRDLHDDVGTKLSALKMFVSSLRENAASTNNRDIMVLAESSEQFIKEVISDVRSLLHNLSPAVLEEFGYVTAVEGLINKLNDTGQLCFTLTVFGMDKRIQRDYELALYRITQELINNVLKHAEAKNVSLQIGLRDHRIILMIDDDGKGFDTSSHLNGYGLTNLAARTKLMQGTMNIDSKPSRGTNVSIEIPYESGRA